MSTKDQLATIATKPGIYMFKNKQDEVLYVGKAKSLKTRVRSYFRDKADLDPAKRDMIPKITTIETIVVDTENEALILEANLIRQHQPPYNVVLRDDKYYLFIKVTKETFPRVFPVRRLSQDGAKYFGPYSSARSVRQTLKLLRRIFPHRAEKESPREKIFPHPLFATANQKDSAKDYQKNINNIIRFLKGQRQEISATLQTGMKESADAKAFERAAIFRDQLSAIQRLEGDQKVRLPHHESFDVISIATDRTKSAANIFQIRDGKLLYKNTFLLKHRLHTGRPNIVRQFLLQYYRDAQDVPKLILIPDALADQASLATWINTKAPPLLIVPKRGKKKQLLTMGELNAQQLLTSEQASFERDKRGELAMASLAKALGLNDAPLHRVETYDISNIQGTLATGSMVVFIDGQPAPKHYRKFRIKLGDTPNDYAMLQEVLQRRFSNRHTGWPKPDLILIDGGKGQLSAAKKILDSAKLSIPVAALAKKEETLFINERTTDHSRPARSPQPDQQPKQTSPTKSTIKEIQLAYDDDALYLVQRMRDEAHRFTITYHRSLRSKKSSRSILDEIPGLGPKTKKQLLSTFGSLKAIKAAPPERLAQTIGAAKARQLLDYL